MASIDILISDAIFSTFLTLESKLSSLSIMFKTFREVFGLISRDVGILYRFSEQRSIRESVLYKNDIEYIYCYLNAIIGSYNYEGLDTIICSFKSDFENEVDNMLTVETVRPRYIV